ncbi:DUF2975 domain-containing protein [Cellvibrio sp. UBA7661]|uniref:DUF2975 domain-containing protein n=1 Tax=Cellvibrio sp. UBA7661 TaxID=1946311 RepID=UPI002F3538D6
MDIQQHERITRIKTLSRYLYWALTGIQYLMWVLLPLTMGWLWFGTKGMVTLFDHSIDSASLSLMQRCLLMIPIALFVLVLLKVVYHLRQLILHFASGKIFNKAATAHARKALHYALAAYGFSLLAAVATWIYLYIQNNFFSVTVSGDFIFGIIIFGLMYVLLWALEIGCDLNEESELTI